MSEVDQLPPPQEAKEEPNETSAAPEEVHDDDDGGDNPVDAETQQVFTRIMSNRAIVLSEKQDIELLQLTKNELEEMLHADNEYGKNEYFDLKYFCEAAQKCWEERRASDASVLSASTVKLFPSESTILQRRKSRDFVDSQEWAQQHPLLYRRIQRYKQRRQIFKSAMESSGCLSRAMNTTLSLSPLRKREEGLCYTPERDLMPPYLTAGGAPFASSPNFSTAEWHRRMSHGDTKPAESPAKKSGEPTNYKTLLREQSEIMGKMAKHDEEVYQPLLKGYLDYDAAVHSKMAKLLELSLPPEEPKEEDAKASS